MQRASSMCTAQHQGKVLKEQAWRVTHEQCELTCIGHDVTPGIIDVDHVHGERALLFGKKLPQSKGCHLHREDAVCQCVLQFAIVSVLQNRNQDCNVPWFLCCKPEVKTAAAKTVL